MYQWFFEGTCVQANSVGGFNTTKVTQKTLLNDFAQNAGVDPNTLALVYHIQGSDFGDTVDVINASTGAVVINLFGFYFGEFSGRQAITNSTGTIVKRLDYIYTQQNDHSLGAALVTKNSLPNAPGRPRASGTMSWVVVPNDGGSIGTKICNGSFTVGRQVSFGQ